MALPKTLGGLEVRYVALETEISAKRREIKDLEAEQEEILKGMSALCTRQRIQSHRGARYTFSWAETEHAQIENWGRFLGYVVEKGEFELVQKRVGLTAARERWQNGVTIPGIVRTATLEFKARALPGKAA